jgi:lysozyme
MTVRNKVTAAVAVVALSLSTAGTDLIRKWEGTKQNAYLDAVGVPTICTGSTRNVYIGQYATLGECEQRLVEDTSYAGKAIKRLVKVKLTQEQYDALVSLTFNIGEGNFAKSTLLKRINSNDCYAAGLQFNRWVYAKGRKLRGLVARRADESALFLTGCTNVY